MMRQTDLPDTPNLNSPVEAPPTPNPSTLLKDYLQLLIFSGGIIWLDTWTKELVKINLPLGKGWLPDQLSGLMPYMRIIHLQNKGTAFGLFHEEGQINLVISVIAVLASLFIIVIFPKIEKKETTLKIALILQLAGSVGNLISRIRYGYVLDFISVGEFPVFNIADSSITLGLVVLLAGMLVQEYKDRKLPPANAPDDETSQPPREE